MPAPLIWLTATNATLAEIPPDCAGCSTNFTQQYQSTFTSGLVLGIDQQGPAGVLPAGAHGSIQFQAMPTGNPVTFTVEHLDAATPDILIGYTYQFVEDTDIFNCHKSDGCYIEAPLSIGSFNNAKDFCSAFQPPFASTAGFSRTCMELLNGAGYQWIDITKVPNFQGLLLDGARVNNLLAADATALSEVGIYEHDFSHLLNFEYLKDGFGTFNQRYHQGAFGFGSSHSFDITAEIYNGVPVVHYPNGSARQFPTPDTANSNQYLGSTGDNGVVSIATDGSWLLRETSGIVYHFIIDPVSNSTNRHLLDYTQDLNGNRITLAYTNDLVTGASDNFGNTITFAYDKLGHITQSTDPVGRITNYTYSIKSDSLNSTFLTSITNAAGTTSISWNEGGASGVGYFSDSCVATYCEPAIGINTITYPDGTHSYFTYDSLGRMASTYQDGNTENVTFSYDTTGAVTTTDAAGNASKSMPDVNGNPAQYTDPLGSVTQFSYDPENKLTGVHEPLGTNSFYSYDALGNPASMIDPLGNQENLSYTAYNSLQSFTDDAGNATAFAYDSHNNQTGTTYPDGSTEQYTYDSHGNITSWTNRRGHTIIYAYNAQNLPTSKTYASGAQVSYTYDSHYNLSSVTASNGTTSFTYDSADRLTGVGYPNGKSIQYAYNSSGQRASMTDSTGFKVNYSYDAAGRLSKLANGSGALIVTYTYDTKSRLTKKLMGNGTYTTFAYDADDNPLHLINYSSGGAVLSKFDYTYDALGNQIAVNSPSGAWSYGYDADSEITSVTYPGGSDLYTYDADGNRLTGSGIEDNLNNLDEYTAAGATAYLYDADGNLISGGGWTYSYDDDNRLIGMSSTTDSWTYQYDGLGNRVAATHNGTVTQYLNDPSGMGNVEAEFNSSGQLVSHYTYGLDLTSSVPAGGTAAYYNFDAAGNTAQMTNATGSIVNSYTYLPFGEKTASITGVINPFTYVGEFGVMDEGSGLYFMRNRWYSPALGRFVQQDPIGLAGGTNLYRYSINNPLISMDPNGTCPGDNNRTFVDDISDAGSSTPGRILNAGSGLIGLLPGGKVALVGHIAGQVSNVPTEASLVTNGANHDLIGVIHDGGLLVANMSSFIPHPAFKWLGGLAGSVDEGSQLLFNWGAHKWYGGDPNIPANTHQRPCGGTPPNDPPPVPPIPPNDPGDPLFNKQPKDPKKVPSGSPKDPNGKITSGFGDQGYIPAGTPISYTVFFENESNATAPAEIVTVTDPLDKNLDWSTVQLSQMQFNNVTINVPNGGQSYTGQVSVSTDPNPVKVTAGINPSTGVLTWSMQSVDPATGGLPANPMAGFLPPNNSSNQGAGSVTFSVLPKAGLADGTAINNQASIVFDHLAAIATNTVTNTIDTTTPTSTVNPLSAITTSTSIPVSWSGSDPSGSGIASYNIFVSINGGAYAVWLPATSLTSSTYTGAAGNTYSFYSIATSNVGTTQATPGAVQTIAVVASYTVTPSAGTGGSIKPNTAQTVASGSTISFKVTPNSGFQVASVTGCGGTLNGTTYTTDAITANCTVTASFSALVPIATLTSPTPGSTITTSSSTFTWTNGTGVTVYSLTIGDQSKGSSNLFTSGNLRNKTSISVPLPINGENLFARLCSYIAPSWQCNDYTYSTSGTPVLAQLTAPAPGSTITGSSATFQWSAGAGVTNYILQLGSTGQGSKNLYNGASTTALQAAVTGLPTNGLPIYARLYSQFNGSWARYVDYILDPPTAAALTSPTSGALAATGQTFTWAPAPGATGYTLFLGTTGVGSGNLLDTHTTSTSVTAGSLPINGETIYVRLWTNFNGVWKYNDYTFTAAAPAALTSPTGTTIATTGQIFTWAPVAGATGYTLYLGTSGRGFRQPAGHAHDQHQRHGGQTAGRDDLRAPLDQLQRSLEVQRLHVHRAVAE